MKNNLYPTLLWVFLHFSFAFQAQTFIDLPGPMGVTRSLLKGPNGEIYLGTQSKGVYHSVDNGQNWTGLGGNTIMTGRINELCFDTSGQLYVATEQGGIKWWNGTAWTSINTGLFTACGIPIPIRSLVTDTAGNLFAGAHGYSACFPSGDLYSYDGSTWSSISAGLGNTNVNSLAIHPINGDLYAGTDGGVFRYQGNIWTAFNTGLSDTTVHKIVFAPNGDLFAGTNAGISTWTVGATTWTDINSGLNGNPVHAIALDQAPLHMIISTGYSNEQTGSLYGQLYETFDGGNSWTQIAPNLQTTVVNALAFVDNQTCLAAGWGVFRSSDNGQTWAASNAGFSGKTFNTQGRLAVTAAPNHALFYGSDNGVFRSTDEGLSWTMASLGLSRQIVTLLKADHFGNLFCGVMRYLGENSVGFGDGMLYKSTDNGAHWLPVTISKDWRYMEMSELANGDLICAHGFGAQLPSATIVGSSLAISTDHGDTWTDLDVKSGMAFCCAANATGDLFVAGESQSVYRSTNGGNSFDLIVAPGQSGNVGTLEISPSGEILMGSGGQRTFFFSSDNGASYETFSSPVLPDYRGVSDVVFDDLGNAYCTTSGQGGSPSMFTISPPFTANSTFTPVAGLAGSLFKMSWDECGYLYVYRTGGVLKSSVPLRLPEDACFSATESVPVEKGNLEIYPNPATNTIHLHSENLEAMPVELWHWSGQKVIATQLKGDLDLSLAALPAGIYLLKTQASAGIWSYTKIVKE